MAVCGVKEVFLTIDPFPAQKHFAVGIEVIGLAADRFETGGPISVLVKIVSIAVYLLELICAVGAVLVAVFDAAGGLDKLCYISISGRKSCRRVCSCYSRRAALHTRRDNIIQSIVELIVNSIYYPAGSVFYLDIYRVHISLAGYADMTCFDRKCEHSVVSGAVNVAGVFDAVNGRLHPASAEGGGTVAYPVIVSKRGIHFFEKRSGIAGISSVVVKLKDIGADIDPAADDLVLGLLFDISAVEIGDGAGCDLSHERVVVDVTGIVSAAAVAAPPKNRHFCVAYSEGRAFFQINDLRPRIVSRLDDIIIAVKKTLAVTAGLSALFEIGGVRQVNLAYIESAVIKDRRNLIHMIIVIVGKIDIKIIEMMVIKIIYQSVVFVPDICIHQKILSAAGDHS